MIGVIIHGPEVVDKGNVSLLLSLLDGYEVSGVMAGTTGICALVDNGLNERISHFKYHKVSDAVLDLSERCEEIIIQNDSKTLDGSMRFISVVMSRIGDIPIPVVYVDNHFLCNLSREKSALTERLSEEFSVPIMEKPSIAEDADVRTVHGALVGENIWIDGNVIGKVVKTPPRIWMDGNGEPVFEGIEVREHGLQHVGSFDPINAKIRTGLTRRTDAAPRSVMNEKENKAVLIDHDTEEGIRNAYDALYAVSVGDDTTRNSSSILYRFSVPVIGITDGDEDGICREDIAFPGSVRMRVKEGQDDIFGNVIRESLFQEGSIIHDPPSMDVAVDIIKGIIGDGLLDETRY